MVFLNLYLKHVTQLLQWLLSTIHKSLDFCSTVTSILFPKQLLSRSKTIPKYIEDQTTYIWKVIQWLQAPPAQE